MNKLDVGCGERKYPGHIGMDIVAIDGVDIVHNIDNKPWPFKDNTFDEVIMDDILEHSTDILVVLSELYRISRPNALIRISVPHFSSDNMYSDPTHRVFFSSRSFNYFDKSISYKHGHYLPFVNFHILKVFLSFREILQRNKEVMPFNPFKFIGIEWLINRNKRLYERFFAWLLPCAEIYFELRVIKS
jgi:SAM-dependent methyltransferase